MRIISKFHDYYDGIQREGSDRSLIYLRHLEQYNSHNDHEIPEAVNSWLNFARANLPSGSKQYRGKSKTYTYTEIHFNIALFAGRLYPYARVSRHRIDVVPEPDVFVYDLAELHKYAEEHESSLYSKWRWVNDQPKIEEFFNLKGSERYLERALTEKLVVVFWIGGVVNVNGCLKDIEFYRVMPPWQAFQELSMFLGNIAAPNNPMVVISDKSMIAKHGFDKMSFRKPKEK